MKFIIPIAAFLVSGSALSASPQSCTAQMKNRPFTTQKDASSFGEKCLIKQGAVTAKLTKSQVLSGIEKVIKPDHALTTQVPADISDFCPAYGQRSAADRALVWRTLVAAITRPESNRKTTVAYWEKDQRQYSIGLLQLSLADENAYACGLKTEVDLTDPDVNLACGAKILTKLVTRDGRIGGEVPFKTKGGAAYWSTLRKRLKAEPGAPTVEARKEIINEVRSLPVCQQP